MWVYEDRSLMGVCIYVSDRVLQVLSTDIHSSFPLQRLRSIFIFTVWRSFWHASLLFTHSLHFSFSLFPPYPDICMFLSVFLLYIKRLLVSYSILFSIHSSSSYILPFQPSFLSLLHFGFLYVLSLSFESAAHQSYNLNSVRALLPPQHFCREREDRGKKEHKQWQNRRRESL